MKKVEIRRAKIEDLRTIQELNNSLFELEKQNYDPTLVRDWLLTEEGKDYFSDLITNHYVIVATIKDEVVGYLAGTINEQGSYEEIQYGEINNMLVKDECRGEGVGRLLISEFKIWCQNNNIDNLKVTASFKNKNAIEFYRRNGFEEFDLTLTSKI